MLSSGASWSICMLAPSAESAGASPGSPELTCSGAEGPLGSSLTPSSAKPPGASPISAELPSGCRAATSFAGALGFPPTSAGAWKPAWQKITQHPRWHATASMQVSLLDQPAIRRRTRAASGLRPVAASGGALCPSRRALTSGSFT